MLLKVFLDISRFPIRFSRATADCYRRFILEHQTQISFHFLP